MVANPGSAHLGAHDKNDLFFYHEPHRHVDISRYLSISSRTFHFMSGRRERCGSQHCFHIMHDEGPAARLWLCWLVHLHIHWLRSRVVAKAAAPWRSIMMKRDKISSRPSFVLKNDFVLKNVREDVEGHHWSQWSGRRTGRHRPAWLQRGSKLLIQPGHRDPAISDLGVTTKRHAALLEGRAPTGPSPARHHPRETHGERRLAELP